MALVIGNGAYKNAPRLLNPRNDAEDVAAVFKRSGFETIVGLDLDKVAMDEAEIRFARAARTADVAVFYYSGHAIQFAGVNYLAPVDIKLTDEADLRRMVKLDELVSDVQQAKNLRILVLDACRDNPLADELKRSIGATRALPLQRGLAKIDAPQGMIVAYATQAGQTAMDGDGRNSPYTAAFLKHIEEQEEIGTVFRRVSADVYETTKHDQLPELSLSLIGEFYLKGRLDITVKTPQSTIDPCIAASDHWKSAEAIGTIDALQDHLKRFPTCTYAGLAQAKIDMLKKQLGAAPSPESRKDTGPGDNVATLFGDQGSLQKATTAAAVATDLFKLGKDQKISCSRALTPAKLNVLACRSYTYILNTKTSEYSRCWRSMALTRDNKEVLSVQTDGDCTKVRGVSESDLTQAEQGELPSNPTSFFGQGGYSITAQQKMHGCITISTGLSSNVSKCLDIKLQNDEEPFQARTAAAPATDLFMLGKDQKISCSRALTPTKLDTLACRSYTYILNTKTSEYSRCWVSMALTRDKKEVISVQTDGDCTKTQGVSENDLTQAEQGELPSNPTSFFGQGGYSITEQQKAHGCITISSGLGSNISKCLDIKLE